uniref:Serine/threonine-protein kinase receptor n=1 Tax=Cacopsylla melanoneura TaxID=428564 RepID=A0A8D9A4H4_9HEMI
MYKPIYSQCVLLCIVLILFIDIASGHVIGTTKLKTSKCEYHNETQCQESNHTKGCSDVQICEHQEGDNKRTHCFVLWQNDSNGQAFIKMKGCFLNNMECYDKPKCVEKRPESKKNLNFCCCEGDMCNKDFAWEPVPLPPPMNNTTPIATDSHPVIIFLYTMLPVFALIIPIMLCFWYYRQRKLGSYFNQVPTLEPHPTCPPSPQLGCRSIQLVEVKAQGRFGAVWKAKFKTEYVAVKIFMMQDKQSWVSEQEIFKLPHMEHDNVLRYIGAEKRGESIHTEFWLITAFHERGSLCDFLKCNIVTWEQVCRIALSMSKGLMHLHEEVLPNKADSYKPAVAHRDFKSNNVLLKTDLTAAIADFGLALIFEPNKPCGDTHGQVGTRRYMAPEVLEGAINFSRDAFLRIDMYACALVLWELASRCSSVTPPPGDYRLPFSAEVGDHPSLEDMQEAVVHKKLRPTLPETWRQHPGMLSLCDTMEECWDHDAEARLSASCVVERVAWQTRALVDSAATTNNNNIPNQLPPSAQTTQNRFTTESTM